MCAGGLGSCFVDHYVYHIWHIHSSLISLIAVTDIVNKSLQNVKTKQKNTEHSI